MQSKSNLLLEAKYVSDGIMYKSWISASVSQKMFIKDLASLHVLHLFIHGVAVMLRLCTPPPWRPASHFVVVKQLQWGQEPYLPPMLSQADSLLGVPGNFASVGFKLGQVHILKLNSPGTGKGSPH